MTAPTTPPVSGTLNNGVDPDRTLRAGKGDQSVKAPVPELRQGRIVAVDIPNGQVSILLGAGDTPIPQVTHLSNYRPNEGDNCWVLVNGPDMLVLDRTTNLGPSVISKAQVATVSTSVTQQTALDGQFGTVSPSGPAVSTTISPSGRVLFGFSAAITCESAGGGGAMGINVYGQDNNTANVVIYTNTGSAVGYFYGAQGSTMLASRVLFYNNLPPGDYSFSAVYTSINGIGRFASRQLWVLPL